MKKLLVLFVMTLFVGVYSTTANTISTVDQIVSVDKDKCPKCGDKKCDGKCDATSAKGDVKANKNTKPCDKVGKKACCNHDQGTKTDAKKSDVKTGKTSDTKKEGSGNKMK